MIWFVQFNNLSTCFATRLMHVDTIDDCMHVKLFYENLYLPDFKNRVVTGEQYEKYMLGLTKPI